ncbi:MAG: Orthopoxvirus protein of unknown function [Planctomycetota bacterium]|nr:Orthopoxvirus protein of unknown function [Planctomycetota bacterium]
MIRIFGWILALAVQGHDNLEPTDRLVPPGFKGNPWGPAATLARATGKLPVIPISPLMAQWDTWGRTVLKEGDIVFRRGDARVLFGKFPFSKWLANADNSAYSHTGIVAVENGEPVVYDTTYASVRRQPFSIWVLDNVGQIGVKRLKPDQQSHVPAVIAFCRKLYAEQPPFDYELALDDKAFYCLEMTEKAFRASGLTLSQAIRVGDMERISRTPYVVLMFQMVTPWVLEKGLTLETEIFLPGNDRHGIWASPLLETVYPPAPVASATTGDTRN